MASSPANTTERELKILVLHGKGFQGLGIISTIDELCSRIAQQMQLSHCPKPCEIFDVICGTGIGAFIAVLLGRYCFDISSCKQLYMDLVEFVEEKELSRRLHRKDILQEDVQSFMETLKDEEIWTDAAKVSVLERVPRRQRVFIAQRQYHRQWDRAVEVYHGLEPRARNNSACSSRSPNRGLVSVAHAVAASIANPVEGWISLQQEVIDPQSYISRCHKSILTTMEEIIVTFGPNPMISFMASVGPSQSESKKSLEITKVPRSPIHWIEDRTTPIRSVFMWPVKAAGLVHATDDLLPVFVKDHISKKSILPMRWSKQGDLITVANEPLMLQREAKENEAVVQLRRFVNSGSDSCLFDFRTTLNGVTYGDSDMVDLKETRSNIQEVVKFMDGTGLLEEASRQFVLSPNDASFSVDEC